MADVYIHYIKLNFKKYGPKSLTTLRKTISKFAPSFKADIITMFES